MASRNSSSVGLSGVSSRTSRSSSSGPSEPVAASGSTGTSASNSRALAMMKASLSSGITSIGFFSCICRNRTLNAGRLRPAPLLDRGHVVAIAGDVLLVLDQFVAHLLLGVSGEVTELRHAVDHVAREMEAVEIVADDHVERCGRRPLLPVAANVDVVVVGAAVGQPVD